MFSLPAQLVLNGNPICLHVVVDELFRSSCALENPLPKYVSSLRLCFVFSERQEVVNGKPSRVRDAQDADLVTYTIQAVPSLPSSL